MRAGADRIGQDHRLRSPGGHQGWPGPSWEARSVGTRSTRELAAQIETEMALLLGPGGRRRVAAFYGGVGFASQLGALRRGVDVAVACPGRLTDLIERHAIDLSNVSIVVIDEADRMADMGFLPDVKRILDQVRSDRQTLLFSATLDGDVDVLVRRYQHAPVMVEIEPDDQQSRSTSHHWIDTRREHRVALAVDYVTAYGSAIVFCRTKHGADRVAKQLAAAGVKAVPCTGTAANRSENRRWRRSPADEPRRWSPPTWPPAVSTSTMSGASFTSICRPPTRITFIGQDAPAGPVRRAW